MNDLSKIWEIGDEMKAERLNNQTLKVVAQDTPDLTLKVLAGVCFADGSVVKYAGGNTPTIAAPAANPRIDLVVINSSGTIQLVAGTENASPSAPAYPSDKAVLAEVYCKVGQTQIFNADQGAGKGYVYRDARALGASIVLIASSSGAGDAGKGVKTDAAGQLALSFFTDSKLPGNQSSSGAGDAGKLVKLAADGKVDETMLTNGYSVGALKNSVVKLYYNVHLLFILWVGAVVNDTTTTLEMWLRSSTDAFIAVGGAMLDFRGTGADDIRLGDSGASPKFFYKTASTPLDAINGNTVIMDFWAKLPATSTGDIAMGFGSGGTFLTAVYNATSVTRACFTFRGSTGIMYATTADATTTSTQQNTDISSGLDVTRWNNYRIEYKLGTEARFYINGVLKATLSGGALESTARDLSLGFGRSNTALFQVTAPYLSIEMNP